VVEKSAVVFHRRHRRSLSLAVLAIGVLNLGRNRYRITDGNLISFIGPWGETRASNAHIVCTHEVFGKQMLLAIRWADLPA